MTPQRKGIRTKFSVLRPKAHSFSSHRQRSLLVQLITSFIIVMFVPIVMLTFYYIVIGNKTILENLKKQGESDILHDSILVTRMLESYRHKTYLLTTNELIIQAVTPNPGDDATGEISSKDIYEELFSIMKGDTYIASANIVSDTGNIRYSTHLFPAAYDVRYQSRDMKPFFTLSLADSTTASLMSLDNRYASDANRLAGINIFRRIRQPDGTGVGYGIVDIFLDSFYKDININGIFSDVILIDRENFLASSLLHTERYGSFSTFPNLSRIRADRLVRMGSRQDGNAMISWAPITGTAFSIVGITETASYTRNIQEFFSIVAMVSVIGLALSGVLAYIFSRTISRPVEHLVQSMRTVENGEFTVSPTESHIKEIAQLDDAFSRMIEQIVELLRLTREEEEKLKEAERKALESQMNPHFLYNTLNAITALAKLHGEQEILTITTKLGMLLRNSIDTQQSTVTLRDSLTMIENYLAIQKIRFGDKLKVTWHVDESLLDIHTPKLIIQPFVENSIIHGLEPKRGEWKLAILVEKREGFIFISIRDNGVGFPPEGVPETLEEFAESDHCGMYNVYRRLKLHYGDAADIQISSIPNKETCVILSFPLEDA
ncbi:sensor histidine kinase [Parasphaerochaeta coccoides]|uniref:Integral membrane sensor signal transduction histidine kinase n=1 Tax=Parasphaerochaeta coccoides (strain ATCC BAA-1237 / DSM 17374 / SPN1) TaxID=760011 RepID=F4GJZ1_PARC1|nr:sensor histidine kinase [Parasphaerochaeta coccoides]AEC01416.1 integral membrane sensor signal transduction histidine kinase [Parasphaerochaeta coccoides DSM 17374]